MQDVDAQLQVASITRTLRFEHRVDTPLNESTLHVKSQLQTFRTPVANKYRRFPSRNFRSCPQGFSAIELAIMISVIGIVLLFATPLLSSSLGTEHVRGAKVTFTGLHAKARAVAIQRASRTILEINSDKVVIHSVHPVTGVADTVGAVVDFADQFGVELKASRDSLQFDTRGIGTEPSSTVIVIEGTSSSDTLKVSRTGRFYP